MAVRPLRVGVVIPAFNEARILPRVLSEIWPECVARIVVVDDGSADETAKVAERNRAKVGPDLEVIQHAENRGVGAAIATGYERLFSSDIDVAVVVAGDGQMRIDELEFLLHPIRHAAAEYVKGERMSHADLKTRMPWTRRLGNAWLSAITSVAVGERTQDSQCGYTAITREAYFRMHLATMWKTYGYPNEVLARAIATQTRWTEVAVSPIYADEQSGIGMRHVLFVVPAAIVRAGLLARGYVEF